MKTIDLNADVGESYGRFAVGQDDVLMPYLSSCNIACGFHGGDPLTIRRTIDLAMQHNVAIGAHPSYPDLMGFGRRKMHLSTEELSAALAYQISAVKGLVEAMGGQLHHVKPHGALNNHMMEDEEILNTVIEVVRSFGNSLIVYLPYAEHMPKDPSVWLEVFADRTYEDDLKLTPRSVPGSLLDEIEAAEDHLEMLLSERCIQTRNGALVPIDYQTMCIHGDNPAAVPIAQWIDERVKRENIRIGAL